MIAFVIHDACCSGDTVMFAESFETWLENYIKKNGYAVFEKRGEIDSGEEFGRLYRLGYSHPKRGPIDKPKDELPKDLKALKTLCKKNGWEMMEPEYVQAHTVTDKLELSFGG